MEERTIPVVDEQAEPRTARHPTGVVRVRTQVRERLQPVEAVLDTETVEVLRVPQDRFVEAPVPDRVEGDTLVVTVVEEVAVVETRLRVVEEVRITRRHQRAEMRDEVPLRRQEVVVDRKPA